MKRDSFSNILSLPEHIRGQSILAGQANQNAELEAHLSLANCSKSKAWEGGASSTDSPLKANNGYHLQIALRTASLDRSLFLPPTVLCSFSQRFPLRCLQMTKLMHLHHLLPQGLRCLGSHLGLGLLHQTIGWRGAWPIQCSESAQMVCYGWCSQGKSFVGPLAGIHSIGWDLFW